MDSFNHYSLGSIGDRLYGHVAITDDRLTVTVTVPPGCTAVLEIPTPEPGSVHENHAPAAARPGVLGVASSTAGATLRLTSGRFTFTATAPLAAPGTTPG
jgi:alpha-L-rhamnosidase